jgi:hypothetical protein
VVRSPESRTITKTGAHRRVIKIPDDPRLMKPSYERANFREVFDLLANVVRNSLGPEDEMYTKKKRGFVAWKRYQGPDMSLRKGSENWLLYFFWITCYNEFTFRLRGDLQAYDCLTAKFWPPVRPARSRFGWYTAEGQSLTRDHYRYELSFVADDIPKVACDDLITFVESTFEPPYERESIWYWPLFAHDQSFPWYAWSKTGKKEYDRRRHGKGA